MPFEDNTFDTILSIDCLCSVDNPQQAMQEIKRVMKADGELIMVEHGRTHNILKDLQLCLVHLFTYTLVASSMIRDIKKYIQQSGLRITEEGKLGNSFHYYLCKKET